jgi:hypothetical protein
VSDNRSENPDKEGLDRRDFMIASAASVGAAATLAMSAGALDAQSAAAPAPYRHRAPPIPAT